jgi:nitrite reductase/ring-hydroxylating ferredoxin subunit
MAEPDMARPRGDRCEAGRRAFLLDTGALLAGVCAALAMPPEEAQAFPLVSGDALSADQQEATYPVPAADGATIDRTNQVILVRYQNRVYAFSLACPHENAALRWAAKDGRFQCPRHGTQFQSDGVFITGISTRNMDRLPIRRSGTNVVVDLAKMFRSDKDKAAWDSAVVNL